MQYARRYEALRRVLRGTPTSGSAVLVHRRFEQSLGRRDHHREGGGGNGGDVVGAGGTCMQRQRLLESAAASSRAGATMATTKGGVAVAPATPDFFSERPPERLKSAV